MCVCVCVCVFGVCFERVFVVMWVWVYGGGGGGRCVLMFLKYTHFFIEFELKLALFYCCSTFFL